MTLDCQVAARRLPRVRASLPCPATSAAGAAAAVRGRPASWRRSAIRGRRRRRAGVRRHQPVGDPGPALDPTRRLRRHRRRTPRCRAGRRGAVVSNVARRACPIRRFLPELIDLVCNREIEPGKVFDLTLPLGQAAEGYRAMDERRTIKNRTASTIAVAAVISSPAGARRRTGDPAPAELAHRRHLLAQPGRRIQPRVRRPSGREQRRDAHEPVAGPAEHWLGGNRQGGAARGDHLVDRERAVDTEGNRDVDGGRDHGRAGDANALGDLGVGGAVGGRSRMRARWTRTAGSWADRAQRCSSARSSGVINSAAAAGIGHGRTATNGDLTHHPHRCRGWPPQTAPVQHAATEGRAAVPGSPPLRGQGPSAGGAAHQGPATYRLIGDHRRSLSRTRGS